MAERISDPIELILTEELLGRQVKLSLHPEITGHIVRVISYPGRRCPVMAYVNNGEMNELVVEGFQIELVE